MSGMVSFRPAPLRIGGVTIDPPLILAPMAGVTDGIYRHIMAEHGVGLVTTEMVSIQGLLRRQKPTWDLCVQDPPVSVPMAVQLFGRDPSAMAEAAKMVEGMGAAMVDINAGCPVRKVAKQGAGATLLKDPDHLALLVEGVKRSIAIPVTVKIRLGWDGGSIGVIDIVRRLEGAGADAVTIHGRTAVQFYGGCADWSWIKRAKEAVGIPIIGNGDVTSPSLADGMLLETGCDAVMVGRATQGNPWLISSIASRWGVRDGGGRLPDWSEYLDTVRSHVEAFRVGRHVASGHFRKLLIWYSKGFPDSAQMRSYLSETSDPELMLATFARWVDRLREREIPFLDLKVPEVQVAAAVA